MLHWEVYESSLHLNSHEDQKEQLGLDGSVAYEENAIAFRNIDVAWTNNRIREDDGTADLDIRDSETTDGRPGHDSSCHSNVQTFATDLPLSLNPGQWLYKSYTSIADLLGTWKSFDFVKQLRRQLNRSLRPQVPRDHVRLTWICVSCLLTLTSIRQC